MSLYKSTDSVVHTEPFRVVFGAISAEKTIFALNAKKLPTK